MRVEIVETSFENVFLRFDDFKELGWQRRNGAFWLETQLSRQRSEVLLTHGLQCRF